MDFIKEDDNTEEYLSKSRQSELCDFDRIIGYIEDILIDEEFELLQKDFFEKYWVEFEDDEENKHTYMTIFEEYTSVIETYLEERLKVKMPDFCMETFSRTLMERKNELDGEVFEMLLTLTDFLAFKELILDYRAAKEGVAVDLSQGLQITSLENPSGLKKTI